MSAGISIADLRKLPVAERLELVELLWNTLAEEPDGIPVTQAQTEELDRRLAAHADDPRDVSSWDDVRDRIIKKRS